MLKLWFIISTLMAITACNSNSPDRITLDALQGWYEGRKVYYITTDVSNRAMAQTMKANFAPRLKDAVPNYPKPPGQKTVLERVYKFPDEEQSSTIFASIPEPVGYMSQDAAYSPLWLVYEVRWNDMDSVILLTSEAAVLDAEAEGKVSITRTDIVVNCPIVRIDTSGGLGQ